jgi:hypothetical protein
MLRSPLWNWYDADASHVVINDVDVFSDDLWLDVIGVHGGVTEDCEHLWRFPVVITCYGEIDPRRANRSRRVLERSYCTVVDVETPLWKSMQ